MLGGDTEVAPPARLSGVALFHEGDLIQNLARVGQKFLARGRQGETLPGAQKEGDAKLLFEFAEGGGQGRLGHKENLGCGGQGAALGNDINVTKLA